MYMNRLTFSLSVGLEEALHHTRYTRNGVNSYRLCDTTREECGCEHHLHSHLLNRMINYWEFCTMARGKKNNDNSPFTSITFVQCNLNAAEKKEFAKWQQTEGQNLDNLVTEVLQSGHKISWSFNDNSDSFICSVTGKPEGCINA